MKTDAALSIDIGGSKLMAGLVDAEGKILVAEKEPLAQDIDKERLISAIMVLAKRIIAGNPGVRIVAAGVAVPGLADSARGIWVYACFSGIRDFPIAVELSGLLGVPVFIGNDVNVCAWGEKAYGCCRDLDDFIWVTVSNGVGGALFLGGGVYEGAYGGSGEIGHVTVEETGGRLCPCGKSGCLEAQASGRAIAAAYAERTGERGLSAKDIALRAKGGEQAAADVYGMAGRYLGKAIAAFANAMNPARVVLGGGVSMDAELLLPALREAVDRHVFRQANGNLLIGKTALGYNAALLGAAAIAWKGLGRL